MINYQGLVPEFLLKDKDAWSFWLEDVARERGYRLSKIDYRFCSNDEILSHNQALLDHGYHTDIITLDHSTSKRLKVDVYLGVDIIKDNAKSFEVGFKEELARVMVHGLLHCMGWNDSTQEERDLMRKEEDYCLISRPK